jgi:hypothetical protein
MPKMRSTVAVLAAATVALGRLTPAPADTGAAAPANRLASTGPAGDTDDGSRYPKLSLGIVGGLYGALYGYTYLAWYRQGASSETLQFRDEGWFGSHTYAGGADKIGHVWANYAVTRGVSGILEWGGYSKRTSLITATGLAIGFFVLAEIKDGYKPKYGFSWNDVVSNVAGNSLGVAMELWPALDERFDFRIEYWPSEYFIREMKSQGPFDSAEDYTGQRFLVSYHLASIDRLRESRCLGWTEWLDVTLGYQALHYLPAADPNDPVQRLFAGVSLNLQHALDRGLMPEPRTGQRPGAGLRALRFGTEVIAVPYTTLDVGGVSRVGTRGP